MVENSKARRPAKCCRVNNQAVSNPIVAVIGAPFARLGRTSGQLATFNVKRNPGRTASTAAALMIGITLVSFVALFGRSLRGADEAAWKSQVTADYVVTSQNGWDTFPTFAADAGRSAEGVHVLSHVRGDRGRVGSANAGINGIDPATIEQVVSVDVDGASLASLRANEAVIKNRFAEANNIHIGDTFMFRGPTARRPS